MTRPVSLAVGPSELTQAVIDDVAEIGASGLLSESHRGTLVKETVKRAVASVRRALRVPPDHAVAFQPSATAAMELVVRNLVARRAFHFVEGAFAARFAATTRECGREAVVHETATDGDVRPEAARIPGDADLVTITHCETSTGRGWPWEEVRALRAAFPGPLFALDVTSSLGGVDLEWSRADVWFGSAQKCLGLPAGLALVVAGPRALERAKALGPSRGVAAWQDLPAMVERLATGETVETPNVLAVALLGRQMDRWDMGRIDGETRAKAAVVREGIGDGAFHVPDPRWRSLTTHCVRHADPDGAFRRLKDAGLVLGRGYGSLKATCLRIGTYPSVPLEAVRRCVALLAAG